MPNKVLTQKQKAAIKAIRDGKAGSLAEAMRIAGYSDVTADKPSNFTGSVLVQKHLKEMGIAYDKFGLNAEKMAEKTKEWLEAKEIKIIGNGEEAFAQEAPDYKTQLRAGEMWRKDMQLWNQPRPSGDTNITQNNITQNNFTISKEKAEEINDILNAELKE